MSAEQKSNPIDSEQISRKGFMKMAFGGLAAAVAAATTQDLSATSLPQSNVISNTDPRMLEKLWKGTPTGREIGKLKKNVEELNLFLDTLTLRLSRKPESGVPGSQVAVPQLELSAEEIKFLKKQTEAVETAKNNVLELLAKHGKKQRLT